jgi:hypothetical protein
MINYRFDLFKKFKQFDTISMIEIESLYQELLGELVKDGWDLTSNKFEKKLVNEKKYIYHNSDLTILNKFLKEVDWDKDWETLIYDYDEEYPEKHSTNKPLEFSWRANFSVDWFLSIKNQGFINPLIFFPGEELLSRATHRAYMLTKLGYDFPMFIPITEDIDILSNDIFLDNKKLQIKIDIKQKKVEYNFK